MADIDKELNDIKNAVYGREVRGSIHDGIKKINEEVKDSTETSEQAKHQVENIQEQVDNLVVSGDSSVEAAQARVDKDNHNYSTLKERLDTEQQQFETQLAEEAIIRSNAIHDLDDFKADKSTVNVLSRVKADKTYVDERIESLDGLQIKGGFNTLGELQSAYPNGKTGLYVADDYLYAWNGDGWIEVKKLSVFPWTQYMKTSGESWVVE